MKQFPLMCTTKSHPMTWIILMDITHTLLTDVRISWVRIVNKLILPSTSSFLASCRGWREKKVSIVFHSVGGGRTQSQIWSRKRRIWKVCLQVMFTVFTTSISKCWTRHLILHVWFQTKTTRALDRARTQSSAWKLQLERKEKKKNVRGEKKKK